MLYFVQYPMLELLANQAAGAAQAAPEAACGAARGPRPRPQVLPSSAALLAAVLSRMCQATSTQDAHTHSLRDPLTSHSHHTARDCGTQLLAVPQ